MSDSQMGVKALFYVFGREDGGEGRTIDAHDFARAWIEYVTANESRVSLKAAFDQYRTAGRIIGFDAL